MAEKNKSNKLVSILIILIALLVVGAGVVIALLVTGRNDETSSENSTSQGGIIGYEVNASVITSGDVAFSQPEGVAVRFKPVASSTDGINFECEIGNSLANTLDMYIDMYTSEGEQIYISGLMKPGEGITSFKTNQQMPQGSYDVTLVLTLVEDDHSTLHAQSMVALTLMVG